MAVIYVDDAAGGGANNGTSWTDAYTSLDNASVDGAAAGSDIWVASTHNESIAAAVTLNFASSTLTSPITIKSVNTSTDAYSTGAKLTVTGAGNDINLTSPSIFIYGLVFDAADLILISSATDASAHIEDCTFTGNRTSATTNTETFSRYVNCTFTSNVASAASNCVPVNAESRCEFFKCTMNHATANHLTDVLDNSSVTFEDCDLTDALNICDGFGTARGTINIEVRRCQMKASWTTLGAGSIGSPPGFVIVESCTDSTGLTVPELGLTQQDTYEGTVTSVLTPDRTGGADDGENGPYSVKMATNANALEQYIALEAPLCDVWLEGSATETGATSQGIFTSTRMAPQGTPAALTTDSGSTWNGSGVGTKQKIEHALSSQDGATLTVYVASGGTLNNDDFWIEVSGPDQVGGPVSVTAFLAKPSTTVYVDPKVEVA